MIILAILLWVQVAFLAVLTGEAIRQGVKGSQHSAATVILTGGVFGVSTVVSLFAALVVGGIV